MSAFPFFLRNTLKSSKVASATPEETIPEMEEDMDERKRWVSVG